MHDDLTLPDFLNRKLNPAVRTEEEERRLRSWRQREQKLSFAECDYDALIDAAQTDASREFYAELKAEKKEREREERKQDKRMRENGADIYLAMKIENCPLAPGKHTVELVHLGRKWVRFRCRGKTQCVKVRRVIWDAIRRIDA